MNDYDWKSEMRKKKTFECNGCRKLSDSFEIYIEHRDMGGCIVYCDHCVKTFK